MSQPPKNDQSSKPRGRGAVGQVANRFERVHVTANDESVDEVEPSDRRLPTIFLTDQSQSIVSENKSPDIPFRFSLNPYRGCEHGCAYCYARPTHEYLGMSAGTDFESKIIIKEDAIELLTRWLARPGYECEPVMLSGVTDPYQPVERTRRLTRGLLEKLLECRHPVSLITKNALIERDLDVLSELAKLNLVHAAISITTLDAELARDLEPRTSTPAARYRAMRSLADAGVPVRVMTAPVIPGLNDHEIPSLLDRAAQAGATTAGYVMLRLPGAVADVFQGWLAEVRPAAHERVMAKIREVRGGELSDARFGSRMRGEGERADQIAALFKVFCRKLGLEPESVSLDRTQFRPPRIGPQLWLFD